MRGRDVERRIFALMAAVGTFATAACAPPPPAPWNTTEEDWGVARQRIVALRGTVPERPYAMVVNVSLREPRTRHAFEARGALAVDPGRALRMILIGPGGATALDAWVTRDAYRFEVPPVHLLRRGGTEAEPSLPVDFFREWFLTPLGGRLLASTIDGASRDLPPCDGRWFILRHGEATLTLCDELPSTVALDLRMLRTTPASSFEEFRFRGQSLRPHPGDRAEYEDRHSHVQASVDVESVDPAPPDPLAFVDPDRGDAR